ncbi:MAG: hypothetical protein KBS96_00195 [Lachnospiraceae bacterium]|nr:hypothetical protein [Candidatus Colinaster scatohippi]
MDFLYKKHPKGTYEYVSYKRIVDIIITVILFALALGLYIIGRITTGSNRNLLTIVSVLGLLPACKMVVDVIMCFRVKKCSEEFRTGVEAKVGKLCGLYNMYFTSYEKNYYIDHLVITGNSIIGYSSSDKFVEKEFHKHMNDLLRKEGYKDVMIKVFNDADKYLNRLSELNELEDIDANVGIYALINNVTI